MKRATFIRLLMTPPWGPAEVPAPRLEPGLQVELCLLDGGSTTLPRSIFGIDEDGDITLQVSLALIKTPAGSLVFDTGHAMDVASSGPYAVQPPPAALATQLAEVGESLEDVDFLSFSHVHFDHTGRANDVTDDTTVIWQEAEWELALAARSHDAFGVLPPTYLELLDNPRLVVDGDLDVFGDGRVRLLSLPGHTPGSQGLWVDLPHTGPVLLTGDLYHFAEMREHGRVPPFNTDAAETRASMARLEAIAKATGAEVWVTHDPDQIPTLLTRRCFN